MKSKPLSRKFLLKRGYCCNNKCKNCPYLDAEDFKNSIIKIKNNKLNSKKS